MISSSSLSKRSVLLLLILFMLVICIITSSHLVLSNDQESDYDDDNNSNDDNNMDDNNIIRVETSSEYSRLLKLYRSSHHIITLVSFSADQERQHQCLHCKLYRDLLTRYVSSFPSHFKGLLIEFTTQSQELVIGRLKLTHLPSVTIQSKYTDTMYDCNLKENQLWECVKDAFKESDTDLYQSLDSFINMDDIKELYQKYKDEFTQQPSNQHSQQSQNGNQFDFSSLKTITKMVLIAFCIIGFVIGINTLQNLLSGYKYLMFILCILTYILCMSGTVFNMIQNPPPYQYNQRENSIQFFYPSMRMSFALEGYIAIFVLVISSFYLIAIPYYGTSNNTNNNTDIDIITSNTTSNTTTTSNTSGGKKKKKNINTSSSTSSIEDEINDDNNNQTSVPDDSHYKSVLKRLFFIWGFFVTFTAAMIFFMIKTSFYLSDTPYHGWVQLLLAIFNH